MPITPNLHSSKPNPTLSAKETTNVRIVHISDIHLSEDPWQADDKIKWRFWHRHGSDNVAFLALDRCLRDMNDFDIIVLSGDLTRVGRKGSYVSIVEWLWRPPLSRSGTGLDLQTRNKKVVLVPGNHDRFGSRLTQNPAGLVDFYGAMPSDQQICPGEPQIVSIKGTKLAFHRFDSSHKHGSFGQGYIDTNDLRFPPKSQLGEVACNIAVLHHHCFVPAGWRLKRSMKLLNGQNQVLPFLLGSPIDLVMTGHTHRSYFEIFPGKTLLALLGGVGQGRASKSRAKSNMLRAAIDLALNDSSLLSKPRCHNGQTPDTVDYLDYLYMTVVEKTVDHDDQQAMRSPQALKRAVERLVARSGSASKRPSERDIRDGKRIAFSMAPSACQAEVPPNKMGFHTLDLEIASGKLVDIAFQNWTFTGGSFEAKTPRQF